MIEVKETGGVMFNGVLVGEYEADEQRLVLNLGWCRLAGLRLTVEGDPRHDRKRIMLARPDDKRRLAGGDQEKIPFNGDQEKREQSTSGAI